MPRRFAADVIGDFTLELKKVDEDTMIVRAARARLSAEDRKITLQGMDEEGPVKEILTHGKKIKYHFKENLNSYLKKIKIDIAEIKILFCKN